MLKLTDDDFNRLVAYMKKNYGINLDKKRILIEGRLYFLYAEAVSHADDRNYLSAYIDNTLDVVGNFGYNSYLFDDGSITIIIDVSNVISDF